MVLYLILAAGLVLCGCGKGKGKGEGGREGPHLDTLEQPLREGMLTDSNGAVTLGGAFSYESHGYYVIAGYLTGFSYHNYDGKIINISDTGDNLLLKGAW